VLGRHGDDYEIKSICIVNLPQFPCNHCLLMPSHMEIKKLGFERDHFQYMCCCMGWILIFTYSNYHNIPPIFHHKLFTIYMDFISYLINLCAPLLTWINTNPQVIQTKHLEQLEDSIYQSCYKLYHQQLNYYGVWTLIKKKHA
jgi:hypothetical protein